MRREAALTFATGFQANLGVLSCLLDRHDVAFLDALDHACILDGARLGFGRIRKFRHNDVSDLERKLENAPQAAGKLIVVDGVFSWISDNYLVTGQGVCEESLHKTPQKIFELCC